MTIRVDPAVMFYDPYTYGADNVIDDIKPLADDPRCLFGWGYQPGRVNVGTPPSCRCRFGHTCVRELKHPGKCWDGVDINLLPCNHARRPKHWDSRLRQECNR